MKYLLLLLYLLLPALAEADCCDTTSYGTMRFHHECPQDDSYLHPCAPDERDTFMQGWAYVGKDKTSQEDNAPLPGALWPEVVLSDGDYARVWNNVGAWGASAGGTVTFAPSTEMDDFVKRECDRFCQFSHGAITETLSGPGWMRTCECAALLAQQKKAEVCSPARLLAVLTEVADAYGVFYKDERGVGGGATSNQIYVTSGEHPIQSYMDKIRQEAKDLEQQAKDKRAEADRLDQQEKVKADLRDVLKVCK